MEEELICFEVETKYDSGRTRVEVIISKDEESFWKYYYKHHNRKLITSSCITDVWPA